MRVYAHTCEYIQFILTQILSSSSLSDFRLCGKFSLDFRTVIFQNLEIL